jgi:hypothetical protein
VPPGMPVSAQRIPRTGPVFAMIYVFKLVPIPSSHPYVSRSFSTGPRARDLQVTQPGPAAVHSLQVHGQPEAARVAELLQCLHGPGAVAHTVMSLNPNNSQAITSYNQSFFLILTSSSAACQTH